jgi:hypothetical protein
MQPKHIATLILVVAFIMLTTGCAALDGLAFGLDVANAETTMSVSYGDGKGVIAAEQGGNRIGFNVRR